MLPDKKQQEIKDLRKEMKVAKKDGNMTEFFAAHNKIEKLKDKPKKVKKLSKRKCANMECKKEFQKTYSTTQSTCSPLCAIKRGAYLDQKKKDDEAREGRVRRSEELYGLKKFADLEQDLQKLCNEIARLIDKDMTCISCGAHSPKDGGHYLAVKGHEIIRFNLHQIRAQCYTCNRHLEGNTIPYLQAVKKIHGEEYAEYLTTGMMIRYRELRTDRVMITDAIKIARAERNKLRKSDLTYTATERLDLRREINNKLGIYL